MNGVELSRYLTEKLKGVDVVTDSGNSFFFYNPDPNVPPDHRFPFVTLVTNDAYDQFSNLNRPSVFRLNIGVGKQTYRTLFGSTKQPAGEDGAADSDDTAGAYDFTGLDQVMPHPVYGRQYWVCVLNPSDETFKAKVWPLVAEAYDMAVSKYDKQAARR